MTQNTREELVTNKGCFINDLVSVMGTLQSQDPHGFHLWHCTRHEQLKTSDPPYIIELKRQSTVRHSNTYIPLRKKQMWILNYDTMLSWDLEFNTYWKVSYTFSDIDFLQPVIFLCIHKKKNKQNNLINVLLKYFCPFRIWLIWTDLPLTL